ncbi:MAG: helix-turn-helix transcriptional regulator [Anaerolineae bacterium]|nr:helix-turn-helix transcriptional regulator [Anaerolineae bacterium]
MSKEIKKLVGGRVRAAREAANMDQVELAESLGLQKSSVSQIETGTNSLNMAHLIKLVEIFNLPADYFIGTGTKDLAADEVEWVGLFRLLPDGTPKQYVLEMVRGMVERMAEMGGDEV